MTSTNHDVCLFATSLDYVSHVGKCLYWLMKTVAQYEFIEGKTFASVNIKCLTAKLLKQGYRYHKLRKAFSKFYRRHYELISKVNIRLKSLLHQGLSEPEFYGDLVYKFKKIRGMTDFSDQFIKIIMRYKRIGYNLNVMRQSACLVINPITVDGYAALFNCTPVDRVSDSMMAPT